MDLDLTYMMKKEFIKCRTIGSEHMGMNWNNKEDI
jgi:hypothetical protein